MSQLKILVTGGSGFIAGHVILHLVEAGHEVRATLRSTRREEETRQKLRSAGLPIDAPVTFVAADLLNDAGWADAMRGIDVVLHVASPIVTDVSNEAEVVRPAREGTLRVLRAARDAGVRRVVVTSAFHAVGFGHRRDRGPFTEEDWSVIDSPGVDVYGRSKILAERAAWDFVAREGRGLELVTLLPVAVMGPALGTVSGGNHLLQSMLDGSMPGYPNMHVPIVDVRDVAAAHVRAATLLAAAGQRILVATGETAVPMREIGAILREHLGDAARKVPRRTIPDVVVRLAARFNAEFRPVAHDLHFAKEVSTEKMRRVLDVQPRPAREAILAAAESMLGARG